MKQESGANPTWEALSALICVVALIAIVAIVQMWPVPVQAVEYKQVAEVESLAEAWSRAPGLQKLSRSPSFRQATNTHRDLMVWGWLDQSSPKRFQSLSSESKRRSIKMTLDFLAEDQNKGLQAMHSSSFQD